MSEAYASLARQHAIVIHAKMDFGNPPMDGIWGMTELPVLDSRTDVVEIKKRSVGGGAIGALRFWRNERQKQKVAAAIERVDGLLDRKRRMMQDVNVARREVDGEGSCKYWNEEERGMLEEVDRLFGYSGM